MIFEFCLLSPNDRSIPTFQVSDRIVHERDSSAGERQPTLPSLGVRGAARCGGCQEVCPGVISRDHTRAHYACLYEILRRADRGGLYEIAYGNPV